MNARINQLFLLVTIGCLFASGRAVLAQETPPPDETPQVEQSAPEAPAAEQTPQQESGESPEDGEQSTQVEVEEDRVHVRYHGNGGNAVVRIGSNAYLPEDSEADAVVSVIGSSTTEGRVREAVVSIFGTSTVMGPVGDAAVAVFGDTYINSKVRGEAVAVFGDVILGPNAEVSGGAVSVGGSVVRDPNAVIYGGIQEVSLPGDFTDFGWLRPWLKEALLLGRPLAIAPGLGWAWGLALTALAVYILIGLLFPKAVENCAQTLEARPGKSILAALLTMLLSPVLIILLMVTVIGIAVIPFAGIAFFLAGVFGKAVVFAWIGRRLTSSLDTPLANVGVAVLVGGVVVLALYLVPVLGFIVYNVTWLLGLGAVVYTMILNARPKRENGAPLGLAPAPAPRGEPVISSAPYTQPTGPAVSFAEPSMNSASTATPEPEATPGPGPQTGPTPEAASASAPPPRAAATDLTTLPRATFGVRMGALLLDVILVGIVLSMLPDFDNITLLTLATYGAVMWKLKGTTVGGIVFGLHVVRLDGREIDWPTAIVRALGCFLSLAVAFLGFIWIAIDDDRQAWHDKIAGTVVVRVPKGTPLV